VQETLGTQSFEGVAATGTRNTITIPAGQLGNERPILVVDESWFSPDLKVTVMSKHSDPRAGETVYRLTQISRAEPDAQLFQVPADYMISGGGGRSGGAAPAVVPVIPGGRSGGGRGPAPVTGPNAAATVPGIPLVGGPNLLARVTNKVEPQYTEQARAAKWQGTVTLNVVVDETGKPSDITVVKPLGMGLDEAAVTAVSQWRFPLTQINGAPSKVQAQIEVPFRLQ
jgi:TonB family protein